MKGSWSSSYINAFYGSMQALLRLYSGTDEAALQVRGAAVGRLNTPFRI